MDDEAVSVYYDDDLTPDEDSHEPSKHIKKRKIPTSPPAVIFPREVCTLKDLIDIAWYYEGDAFDWFSLWKMIPALTELNSLIGMQKIKQTVIDIIVCHLQDFQEQEEFRHTMITGGAGQGKTTLANILAKIYCCLGYISSEKVVSIKRADVMANIIGGSEANIKAKIEEAFGAVLLIDEAYSLGHGEHTDSFAKAIIDTLNVYLSENRKDFICIIAGYEKEIEKSLFSVNPGLKRRFPIHFSIEEYSSEELSEMFHLMARKASWKVEENAAPASMFTKEDFPFAGGDIENLFKVCRAKHARKVFGTGNKKKIITKDDIKSAMEEIQKKKEAPVALSYFS